MPHFAEALVSASRFWLVNLEAPPGYEPGVQVLQTSALPLGDGAPQTKQRASARRAAWAMGPHVAERAERGQEPREY